MHDRQTGHRHHFTCVTPTLCSGRAVVLFAGICHVGGGETREGVLVAADGRIDAAATGGLRSPPIE
jgi:hypothetical protein